MSESESNVLVSLDDALSIVDEVFDTEVASEGIKAFVLSRLGDCNRLPVTISECTALFDRMLVPEPILRGDILDSLREISQVMPVTAIFYDALPFTHSGHFPASALLEVSPYYRWVSVLENVVCISGATLADLCTLSRSSPRQGWKIAYPGGDHVERFNASNRTSHVFTQPLFVSISSFEKRKRLQLVVKAFQELRREFSNATLVLIGRRGDDRSLDSLQTSQKYDGIRIEHDCPNQRAFDILRSANATISLGDEGLGLVPLESVQLGTPVILGGSQPITEVIRNDPLVTFLDELSIETVTTAMRTYTTGRSAHPIGSGLGLGTSRPEWSTFTSAVFNLVTT